MLKRTAYASGYLGRISSNLPQRWSIAAAARDRSRWCQTVVQAAESVSLIPEGDVSLDIKIIGS
jgi:hypothetical protein